MLNTAETLPPPSLAAVPFAGITATFLLFAAAAALLLAAVPLCLGMELAGHLSAEARGWLVLAGGFTAGVWTCRILSRRCRWA